MKTGLTISAAAHAGLLLWGLMSFSARPLEASADADAAGRHHQRQAILRDDRRREERAQDGRRPKPLVEKIGPTEAGRGSRRQGLRQARGQDRSPPPPPAEAQPEKAEAKPEKKEPPKVDADRRGPEEGRGEEEARGSQGEGGRAKKQKEAAAAEVRSRRRSPRCSTSAIRSARPRPARRVNPTPNLGYANAPRGAVVAERDRRAAPPAQRMLEPAGRRGQRAQPEGRVARAVQAGRLGRGAAGDWLRGTASPFGPAMAESAKRAILTCQPFKMLRPENYEHWKDIEITFDPREMFGG